MSAETIPGLPAVPALSPSAQVWVSQGGTDYRATAAQVAGVNPSAVTVVGSLPAATAALTGIRAFVTDASSATYSVGAAVTGGSTHVVPVYCTGLAWVAG